MLARGRLRSFLGLAVCVAFPFHLAAQGQDSAPLSLHEAILRAQNGVQASAGQDRVDSARGLAVQAGLRPNPRLYLQSEDLRPGASDFDFPNQTEDYAYVGQVFELGGKRAGRLGLARANVLQAQAEQTLLLQQIAGRVAGAYWAAVAGERVVTLLEADAVAVAEIVRYNKERVDAGAMAGIDLLRVQMERDRLLLALETARREAALARIELFKQMGAGTSAGVRLSGSLDALEPVPPQPLSAVLAARADVQAARDTVVAAEADLRLQRSLAVPDLDLFGGYKRNNGADTGYTSLQIPLPFRNRNQGEIARAQAGVRLAQDRLRQLELGVAAEVQAAEETYRRQRAVVESLLPEMRARAKQNLAILDDAYRTGGMDLLRYLDAERAEFEVEASALRALADFQQAGLRLQLAYGVQP